MLYVALVKNIFTDGSKYAIKVFEFPEWAQNKGYSHISFFCANIDYSSEVLGVYPLHEFQSQTKFALATLPVLT